MKKDDADRLERERSIHAATRGPDYSVYLRDLQARQQNADRLARARAEYVAAQRYGFNKAKERGDVQGTFGDPK